jgi:protein SCO1/2
VKRQFGQFALKRAFFLTVLLANLALAFHSIAADGVELKADPQKAPVELQNVGLKEHLGEKIDLNLQFLDSSDHQKHFLKDYFQNGKPTILNLVYYECPMLCTMVLNGLSHGLKKLDWSVGDQFNILTISINPKEDTDTAEEKRLAYIRDYVGKDGAGIKRSLEQTKSGWHFFTSDETSVQNLANQLGFKYEYDKVQQQYAHAAVTYILTPEGVISRNLYGITYQPRDLKLSLLEASRGKVGNVFDRLLMFCYHYEPGARGYSLQAVRVMQLAALATVAALAGYLSYFWMKQSRKRFFAERKDFTS